MKEIIIPYNRNEILLGNYVEKTIGLLNKIKDNNLDFYDKYSISNLINIKTYLSNKEILEYIESKTNMKEKEIRKIIGIEINSWLNLNIGVILEKNNFTVENSLWKEVNSQTRFLKNIDKLSFSKSLNEKYTILEICLKYENVVKYFDYEIGQYLNINYEECINILLKKYEEKRTDTRLNEIYLPSNFQLTNIIGASNVSSTVLKFIEKTKCDDYSRMEKNRLISISKNLNLSPKIKFLADQKYKELNDNFFKNNKGYSFNYGVSNSSKVTFKDYDEKNNIILLGDSWVNDNDDFKTRFIYNCSTFIELISNGRINLDSIINNDSFIDLISVKSRHEYPINSYSSMLDMSVLLTMLYEKMLIPNDDSLEKLLTVFYNNYLVDEFGFDSFEYEYKNSEIDYKSRIILFLPHFDLTLKKIDYFLKNRSINMKYLYFDDDTVNYRTIKSSQVIKNVYINPKGINLPYIYLHYNTNNLFIDNESISVYQAVKNEMIIYSDLEDYNKRTVDSFINLDCLKIREDGKIIFTDYRKAMIYKSLYYHGEIIYSSYNEISRKIIDDEIEIGNLIYDNNFLSKRENDYYSYLMDAQQFSNGLNLRNRYIHKASVSYEDDDTQHEKNYYTILMLFIQITLKFNLELCLISKI